MAKLSDLGLKNEQVGGEVDFDNLPKVGGFTPLLQPGRYRFKLPANLSDIFELVESKNGQRIQAVFDQNAPLVIVKAPEVSKERIGEPLQQRISNVERPRGKDKVLVSDMDYLLKALGSTTKPKTNQAYGAELAKHGGKEFDADIEVQYSCNPNKDIYVDDGTGNTTVVEEKKGCGARYYQKDVEGLKADGKFPERITCSGENCGASLRGFSQLSRIG